MVALQYGPLIYNIESADQPAGLRVEATRRRYPCSVRISWVES